MGRTGSGSPASGAGGLAAGGTEPRGGPGSAGGASAKAISPASTRRISASVCSSPERHRGVTGARRPPALPPVVLSCGPARPRASRTALPRKQLTVALDGTGCRLAVEGLSRPRAPGRIHRCRCLLPHGAAAGSGSVFCSTTRHEQPTTTAARCRAGRSPRRRSVPCRTRRPDRPNRSRSRCSRRPTWRGPRTGRHC